MGNAASNLPLDILSKTDCDPREVYGAHMFYAAPLAAHGIITL